MSSIAAPASPARARRAVAATPWSQQDQRSWRSREIMLLEDERRRLARDLHDEAGHRLTAASLKIDEVVQRNRQNAELCDSLEHVRRLVWECAAGLHEVAFNLRPAILSDLGLAPALASLVRRARETSGLPVTLTIRGETARLSETIELSVFRIVQEALTNAIKYAGAARVVVRIVFAETALTVEIADDGAGFDPDGLDLDRPRLGLKGMRERVELSGGTLRLRARPGQGTTIRAVFPRSET